MTCRMRWVEALEIMEPGPVRDLVRAAGSALSPGAQATMVNLGTALDAVVDDVIAQHPIEVTAR